MPALYTMYGIIDDNTDCISCTHKLKVQSVDLILVCAVYTVCTIVYNLDSRHTKNDDASSNIVWHDMPCYCSLMANRSILNTHLVCVIASRITFVKIGCCNLRQLMFTNFCHKLWNSVNHPGSNVLEDLDQLVILVPANDEGVMNGKSTIQSYIRWNGRMRRQNLQFFAKFS